MGAFMHWTVHSGSGRSTLLCLFWAFDILAGPSSGFVSPILYAYQKIPLGMSILESE